MKRMTVCPKCHKDVLYTDKRVVNLHGTWHEKCWEEIERIRKQGEAMAHDAGMWRN